jgi:hypothetical protein
MRTMLSILLVFMAASSLAAELIPERHNDHLGVRIKGNSLPQSFRHDLTSGLTNRLMIRLTLHQGTRELHSRAIEIAIRYDLWDEKFTMTTRLDGISVDTAVLENAAQVLQSLQEIKLSTLFPMSSVPADADVVVEAVVLLNPIDRERMESVKAWVAQNSRRSSLDPAGAMAVGDMSVSNAIFNRIFEQYASGAEVASAWQETLTTKPFRFSALPHEPR